MSFENARVFNVKIVSGGVKQCALRFPSDAQWCERARRQKTVRHFLGRGKSKSTDVDTSASDLELFNTLRVDQDGIIFDAAEAAAFIERLELAEVVAAEWQGDFRRVELRVPGASTVHVLRVPTQAEIRAHERGSSDSTFSGRTTEIRVSLEPSGELYDKLAVRERLDGYVGDVPIVHKVAAVASLLAALQELLSEEEQDDPLPR